VGSAPFVRRRCDCLASSAPFTNIQTYLLTYLSMSLFDTVSEINGNLGRKLQNFPPLCT